MGKCHITESHVTCHTMKSHNNHGKVVHRPYSNCINSVQEMYEDSIEFSLSITEQRAVGFILAQELAILTVLAKCHKLHSAISPSIL